MKQAEEIFVGIDVSKVGLDVAVHDQEEYFRVNNDETGIARLVERLRPLKPILVVLEPTGGGRAYTSGSAGGGGECQAVTSRRHANQETVALLDNTP
jgi:hypothetical protein